MAEQRLPILPIVVVISGSGRNLQVLLDAAAAGRLSVDIRAVISNKPDAKGLQRAQLAGVPTAVVDHTDYASREAFDSALADCIDSFQPELVVLAGFMRILTPEFTARYAGKMLNVHPSLLPNYRGLNTYQRVLDDGGSQHGVSIHFVTAELDGGPVVLQASTDIISADTVNTLEERVHQQELVIYPAAIEAFAQGRLRLVDGQAMLDNQALIQPIVVHEPSKLVATDYTEGYEKIFPSINTANAANSDCQSYGQPSEQPDRPSYSDCLDATTTDDDSQPDRLGNG